MNAMLPDLTDPLVLYAVVTVAYSLIPLGVAAWRGHHPSHLREVFCFSLLSLIVPVVPALLAIGITLILDPRIETDPRARGFDVIVKNTDSGSEK